VNTQQLVANNWHLASCRYRTAHVADPSNFSQVVDWLEANPVELAWLRSVTGPQPKRMPEPQRQLVRQLVQLAMANRRISLAYSQHTGIGYDNWNEASAYSATQAYLHAAKLAAKQQQ
jgi:hypothetical protein